MRFLGATVAALLLVACSPGGGQSPTPVKSSGEVPSPSITAAPIPSPSPTPSASVVPSALASFPADLPTADAESAAIIEGWQAYWRVYEKFVADPSLTDLTETQHVTTGEESNGILATIEQLRAEGIRSEGGRQFRDVVVNLVGSDSATVAYCIDLSGLRVFDTKTGELVPRSGQLREQATLRKMPDRSWRVEQIRNESAQC